MDQGAMRRLVGVFTAYDAENDLHGAEISGYNLRI